jgi:hypothetical protein
MSEGPSDTLAEIVGLVVFVVAVTLIAFFVMGVIEEPLPVSAVLERYVTITGPDTATGQPH